MVVTSQCNGHKLTGLYVGVNNVLRYFPRRISEIELQLDHLRIECRLMPGFWRDEPEIRDPRLCLWLESKYRDGSARRVPVQLALIPSGKNSFIVGPASLEQQLSTSPEKRLTPASSRVALQPGSLAGAAA